MDIKSVFGAMAIASLIVISATAATGAKDVPGWIMTGTNPADYEMGVEPNGGQNGGAAAFLRAKSEDAEGFGSMAQIFSAGDYLGQRVRFSASVRSEDIKNWAGLWMRVDRAGGVGASAFDNMQNRPIKGTTAWQRYEVVLDVAPETVDIVLGVLLTGPGQVLLEDVRFEIVGTDIPVTDMYAGESSTRPRNPVNLDFSGI